MVILEDGLFERDEEFVVVLSVPMGEMGVEVRQEMATITIEDNDGNFSCSKVHPLFHIQLPKNNLISCVCFAVPCSLWCCISLSLSL